MNRVSMHFMPDGPVNSISGVIDRPKEAIDQKVDYLEYLKARVEKGLQHGLAPREIRWKLLGRGDRFRFVPGGQICKQNLINAFLKNPSSPQRVPAPPA